MLSSAGAQPAAAARSSSLSAASRFAGLNAAWSTSAK
jgi:hypothetical protein